MSVLEGCEWPTASALEPACWIGVLPSPPVHGPSAACHARRDCTRFACRIFTQDALSEMVTDMGRAVHELLTVYGKTNNTLPDVIIMFR